MNPDLLATLRDMIDGGGKGASGPTFEGGGLLSVLANLVARPLGSDALKNGSTGGPSGLPAMPPPAPMVNAPQTPSQGRAAPYSPPPVKGYMPPQITTTVLPPAGQDTGPVYSGRGHVGMPMPAYAVEDYQREAIEYLRSLGHRV